MIMNKQLVILGMHRSGTSSVAYWLQTCGLHLGEKLLASDFSNPKGHFEDIDFLNLHKEILIDNGYSPTGLEEDIHLNISEYYRRKMEFLVKFKNSFREEWGWKDPRTCLMISEYVNLLPDALYLIVYRDYREVVSSLIRRDLTRIEKKMAHKNWWKRFKFSLQKQKKSQNYITQYANYYLNICNQYQLKSIDFLDSFFEKGCIVVMAYTELQKQDRSLIERLQSKGFNLKYVPFATIYEPRLMHNKSLEYPFNELLLNNAEKIEKRLHLYHQASLRTLNLL